MATEDYRALLRPLTRAQDALARLEATTVSASPAVQEGLRARLAYREAAGWLAHHGAWIHPVDLTLRDAGLTGSTTAAQFGHRLPSVLPSSSLNGAVPEDPDVAQALVMARQWRRLAELRSWVPDIDLKPWLVPENPALLNAAMAARDAETGQGGHLSVIGQFHAAALWRSEKLQGNPGLMLWSAPIQQLLRLALQPRRTWLPHYLDCVAEAALQATRELARLQHAESRARPQNIEFVLRTPVLTANTLARHHAITPRAAQNQIRALVESGLLREATGRRAWRAYVLA